MGFMSRRVLPVCGSFCICCPSLRSRSRQPVKRYKKLVADVFQLRGTWAFMIQPGDVLHVDSMEEAVIPKNRDILTKEEEELPNDRKISKLCDYASRNPLRIPKIATSLEQKGYKELRNEHFAAVKIVMASYMKLFSSCKGQMPLFAVSAINIIKTLLEQTRHDDMRVVGCDALFEFAYNQVDGTYVHHLDALLPILCSLARETGEEQRRNKLRSAGLRAVSALIWFMGQHSYMPSEYDHVVSAIMENYELSSVNEDIDGKTEVVNWGGRATATDTFMMLPSRKEDFFSGKMEIPSVCAHICIDKIAQFSKEATTTRRFLEPMFCYFDLGNCWSLEQGFALDILHQFLYSAEKLGNYCFLLPVLVRHLDHKNMNQQPQMKADIVKVVASLTEKSKSEATIVETGILNDMLRHLRNSFHPAGEEFNSIELGWNNKLQLAIQDCLQRLAKKMGDPTPIYEMVTLNLEKLSSVAAISRSTISSLLVLSHIMVSVPELMRMQQSFSETLLHQLSLAMGHSDAQTRVGVHNIFGTVMIPVSAWVDEKCTPSALDPFIENVKKYLLTSASKFSSVKVLLETLWKDQNASKQLIKSSTCDKFILTDGNLRIVSTVQKQDSSKFKQTEPLMELELKANSKELEMTTVRLTEDQATLLLSSLWSEANMDNNFPSNYEAIFVTFSLILLFSPLKDSGHVVFIKVFQLALSLRTAALHTTAYLCPSRQRSVFVLSMAMLVFASRIFNIPGITARKNALVGKGLVDPYLELGAYDLRVPTNMDTSHYASPADNASASEFLDIVRTQNDISTESVVSLVLSNLSTSFGMELHHLREELLQPFSPDEGLAGLDVQLNKAHSWTSAQFQGNVSFDEVVEPKEDLISDVSCTDLPLFLRTPIHTPSANVISVNQLLESALETAGQVAGVSVAASPPPYSDVAMRCEAFGESARRKMPIWMDIGGSDHIGKENNGTNGKYTSHVNQATVALNPLYVSSLDPWQMLQLPPVSHYDNFLRAAGC